MTTYIFIAQTDDSIRFRVEADDEDDAWIKMKRIDDFFTLDKDMEDVNVRTLYRISPE